MCRKEGRERPQLTGVFVYEFRVNEMSEEECSGGNCRREMSARDDRLIEGVGIILGNVGRSRPSGCLSCVRSAPACKFRM